MKKALLISTASFFLLATPAFASSEHSNLHALDNHQFQNSVLVSANTPSVTLTITPSVKKEQEEVDDREIDDASISATITPTCSPDGTYKNHGAYVSCIAHEHGDIDDAARSNIGKKHHEENEETPTPTLTISPTATPTGTPVTSPISTAEESVVSGFNPFQTFGVMYTRFLKFFSHLI